MRKGFTLVETLIAVSIFALVIGAAMSSWLLFMYKSQRVNTQAALDMDVRMVIERFRAEMRNTARETIIFYPENASPYQAVGFALPSDANGDGLMDMDAVSSNILWRQTVVYHVWNQSPYQMRRTLFANRAQNATYAERYGQVSKVVTGGNGASACLAGETATTSVMFENLFTGKLWHAEAEFDGYAPVANTREKVTFGSLPLGPGAHKINFTITGKNPSSTGRALRLDQLSAGVSDWPLEAEQRVVSGVSATPFFVGQGMAGAAYGLNAATTADGAKLSVTVYNDAVEDCTFIGDGRNVAFSNSVVSFDADYKPTGFSDGVYVTRLDGQFKTAWWGSEQAFDEGSGGRDAAPTDLLYKPGTNCVIRIPVRGDFVREGGFGPVFRMYRSAYNKNLQILNPAYAPTDTVDSPDINDPATFVKLAFFQNGVAKTNWAACAEGGVDLRPLTGRLEPVDVGQNYIFSFQVQVQTPDEDSLRAFRIKEGSAWACWVIKGGTATNAMQAKWSTHPGVEYVRELDGASAYKRCLPGLVCMTANYADDGDYISHVYDTRSDAGAAKSFDWEADVPGGSELTMYARSGNAISPDGFEISDAAAWENVAAAVKGSAFSGNTGRYVQFRAVFTAQPCSQYPGATGVTTKGPYRSATPKVCRVLFTWDGEQKYVDVNADLLKGTDCGIFRVDVDGQSLVRGVTMDIEIFKDLRTQGGAKERIRSAMTAEVEPRNSGK